MCLHDLPTANKTIWRAFAKAHHVKEEENHQPKINADHKLDSITLTRTYQRDF